MTCCRTQPATVEIGTTASVCPECLRRLPARLQRAGDEVYLERDCPEHGTTRALIWRGPPDYEAWRGSAGGAQTSELPADCPQGCGDCAGHRQQACCALLEVTRRCDLDCPVCYAAAGGVADGDPDLTRIEAWYRRLAEAAPGCNVQLSGGEPTMRDDLPAVVALARDLGFAFIQLNTNGLRLARDGDYARALAEAGLNTVFLQFDGLDEAAQVALRGRRLLEPKKRAIESCAEAGLGVVLVPTVAAGVNLDRLGAIVEFAIGHLPVVRGVHVQPLAHFGRYGERFLPDDAGRVTLPDVMCALADQSHGAIALSDFRPGDCEHALCSFQAEYLKQPDGRLTPLRDEEPKRCCGAGAASDEAGEESGAHRGLAPSRKAALVARRWSAPRRSCCGTEATGPSDEWDRILEQVRESTFSISGMAFQDAWTLDLERLQRCYLHVMRDDGRLLPFCAFNLTDVHGSGLPGGRS